MPLETGTYLPDLVAANPAHADGVTQGDAHIRLIKSVLKNTFPNWTDVALASTQAQIDTVVGLTSTINTNTSNITTLQGQMATADGTLYNSIGANLFYASPNGSSGAPSWRSLVSADLHGTTAGDNAASGIVGEYLENHSTSTGYNLTPGTALTVAQITLSAGDWDVWGSGCFDGVGTVSSLAMNSIGACLSTTTNAMDWTQGKCASNSWSGISNSYLYVGLGTTPLTCNIVPVRFNVTTPTTVYLVVEAIFSTGGVSGLGGYGSIVARRAR